MLFSSKFLRALWIYYSCDFIDRKNLKDSIQNDMFNTIHITCITLTQHSNYLFIYLVSMLRCRNCLFYIFDLTSHKDSGKIKKNKWVNEWIIPNGSWTTIHYFSRTYEALNVSFSILEHPIFFPHSVWINTMEQNLSLHRQKIRVLPWAFSSPGLTCYRY